MKDKQAPDCLPLLFSEPKTGTGSRPSVFLAFTLQPAPEDFFNNGLTPREQEDVVRRTQKGQRQFLQSRWLLKQLVGSQLAISAQRYSSLFEQDTGRVALTGELQLHKWCVSLSHSHNASAAIVSSVPYTPLGVDVEWFKPSRPWVEMADVCLGPAESEQLAQLQKAEGFYRYWTQKEALAKATGKALSELFQVDSSAVARDHGLSLYSCYCAQYAVSCVIPHGHHLYAYHV
ncbi:4'-phosphopantetheinyl transferase superfamily protein [Lacimicrobium sp. SS2-24]|uniref:4'-phosphopantetheinyl transferase family protein n=1 Tax=Lacimicrobium sp. SS2-24 TaxID=2005569 RepID=UPI000B4ADDCA|nr:4'-phosphopantetheinyl transferase superfamily protein [Lacimicrobium sp. SS2-24]